MGFFDIVNSGLDAFDQGVSKGLDKGASYLNQIGLIGARIQATKNQLVYNDMGYQSPPSLNYSAVPASTVGAVSGASDVAALPGDASSADTDDVSPTTATSSTPANDTIGGMDKKTVYLIAGGAVLLLVIMGMRS